MIYLIAIAFILVAFGFYRRMRRDGFSSTLLDFVIAAVFGWFAGLLIGIGARIGMWSIPFFNGTEPHVTAAGSLRVILVFSLYGIGLGVIYELIFRDLLRKSGLLFGLLVTLFSWYPLANSGVQLLNFTPDLLPLVFFTGVLIALMFVPYALLLEVLFKRWHAWHDRRLFAAESFGHSGLHLQ
jgi:hypothetical protein